MNLSQESSNFIRQVECHASSNRNSKAAGTLGGIWRF
jgi:hypothetical protein